MTGAGPVIADRLKSFLERIEKLLEERTALQGDIRDVFAEAKGVGYDVKTMRKLVTIRAMDTADRAEQETLLDTYMHALGMEPMTREPSEEDLVDRAGRVVAEVERCLDLVHGDGQPPKIADIQQALGCSLGKASKIRNLVADRISRSVAVIDEMKSGEPVREMTADDLGDPMWITDKPRAQFREKVRAISASVKRQVREPTPQGYEDAGECPPFLLRQRVPA